MKKVILIIMDGWGHGKVPEADAIQQSKATFVRGLYDKYPNSELITYGESVGLPEGQMGNSEVGHLNIGAGRIVYQELARINKAIRERELNKNVALLNALNYVKEKKCKLHLIGLVSDGGVHSSIEHLKSLLSIAKENQVENVFIHAFTDGRDCDPKSGFGFVKEAIEHTKISTGKIASVIGRYYAMDRDNRWERVKLAYDLLVNGIGKPSTDILQSIQNSYEENVTDEFIKPIITVDENRKPIATISEGDAVICFNFRTDRCREITRALTQQEFPEHQMNPLTLHFTTMTIYDHTFKNVFNIFDNEDMSMTLGEVMEKNHLRQIRIAETEKYPHVTFFFSGGREKPFEGEKRIMIPSPKVATYDLQPEMSAYSVRDAIIAELKNKSADFICLNFANADMVGHTGVFTAIMQAVEAVDSCVRDVVHTALENEYTVLLTADHGNADYAVNEDGTPNTAHTKNPVPFFLIDKNFHPEIRNGKLADIAPTILNIMGIEIPKEMNGEILIEG
ncbi:MAG TPA: 2,3-bisphosphoglycerate-independent phosphoglycerate mutase [Bacteroidetes bacterium]|nr:2,3-bisphosphoglycerate-independent phosphoglycerate mutase [Bacteroidota bacterium]